MVKIMSDQPVPTALAATSDDEIESRFLDGLQRNTASSVLLGMLRQMQAAGRQRQAEGCAELLLESIIERRDEAALLDLLDMRAAWHPEGGAVCAGILQTFFQKDRSAFNLIAHTGFSKIADARENLRRFRLLRRLGPRTLCHEKTWGFGVILEIDEYARQVVIDFDKKKRHRLSLDYAAETLELISADHILARKHNDPAAFDAWLKSEPAEVVKCALRSFGPISPARFQELMLASMISADAWKPFWDAARKQLKQDPLVTIPAKRTEPMCLLEKEKKYDSAWLAGFSVEQDCAKILDQAEELTAGQSAINEAMRAALEERLAFVIRGAGSRGWGLIARSFLLGRELGITWRTIEGGAYTGQFLNDATFLEAVSDLPARCYGAFFAFIAQIGGATATDLYLRLLPRLPSAKALSDIIACLQKDEKSDRLFAALREAVNSGNASCELIYWLCRNIAAAENHAIGTAGSLALEALIALETQDVCGERLKAKHQLRALFEQPTWLQAALASMTNEQREYFMRRIKNSASWATVDRNAILGRIIKINPELSRILQEDASAAAAQTIRLTSLRSYRARQAQLHKLITIDIPQNSKDIAQARSYGDLRENFEYKSAKETQGLLMRRRQEFENMLATIKSTDFAQFPTATAGIGTQVRVFQPGGRVSVFNILGEWDNDETLGIISSQSKMAKALQGHKPGDIVQLPSETGLEEATLIEVSGLSAAVKDWIQGDA